LFGKVGESPLFHSYLSELKLRRGAEGEGNAQMKDVLHYKDFIGSVHFSAEDECFFGRIVGIDDLVTFEGRNVGDLKKAFREAVEDYMSLCRSAGKPLHKS